jgi:hypothetical protein
MKSRATGYAAADTSGWVRDAQGNSEPLPKTNRSLAKPEADGTVKAIFTKYGVDDWAPPK